MKQLAVSVPVAVEVEQYCPVQGRVQVVEAG